MNVAIHCRIFAFARPRFLAKVCAYRDTRINSLYFVFSDLNVSLQNLHQRVHSLERSLAPFTTSPYPLMSQPQPLIYSQPPELRPQSQGIKN